MNGSIGARKRGVSLWIKAVENLSLIITDLSGVQLEVRAGVGVSLVKGKGWNIAL